MSILSNLFFWTKERAKALFKIIDYLSKAEKYIIYALSAVILVCLVLSIRERFFVQKVEVPAYGKTYTEGTEGEVRFFVPILKQSEAEKDINKLIFSSLIKFNQNGEVIPDLAEKWEISPDGKVYKFYLREAKWHDGQELTTDDVIFTFELVKNEEIRSPFCEILKDVEIKKIDQKTLEFHLHTPLASFLSCLDIPILPKHLLENIAPLNLSTSWFAKQPIGSGPFKIKKMEKNGRKSSITLERNDDYFVKKPYLSSFVFKIYYDEEELDRAFDEGKIIGLLSQTPKEKHFKVLLPQYTGVFFNLERLEDTNLRKALALAVNREEIIKEVAGEKIYFPILPGYLGYKEAEKYEYNEGVAKEVFSKVKEPPAELTLLAKQGEPNQRVAEVLQKQWEALGIKINIVVEISAYFDKLIEDRDYDLLLIGLDQKPDPDPYPFWHSNFASEGYNFSVLTSKGIDKLLEEGRKDMNQEIRKQKYEQFVELIQGVIPAVFLYRPVYYFNVDPAVKGMQELKTASKSDRFWNIEEWYIKSKRVRE